MSRLRLTHIGICVSDWERSLCFYRDVLGFSFVSELQLSGEPAATLLQMPNVDLRAIYLERDGTRIELLHYASPGHRGEAQPRPMNQLGLTHLSMRVDDLASTVAELQKSGVEIVAGSRIDLPEVGAAAVFVTDPDGTRIELVQSPGS